MNVYVHVYVHVLLLSSFLLFWFESFTCLHLNVHTGTTHTIAYSVNGTDWTGLGNSIFTTSGNGVAWNGEKFVAVGEGTNNAAYSYNGINWVALGTLMLGARGTSVTWSGFRWLISGAFQGSVWSTDGINWKGQTAQEGDIQNFLFSTYSSATPVAIPLLARWLAVGAGSFTISSSGYGVTWTGVTGSTSLFPGGGYAIDWNGQYWLAGYLLFIIQHTHTQLLWDSNIETLHSVTCFSHTRLCFPFFCLVLVNTGGSGGNTTLAVSTDGYNWTGVSASASPFSTSTNGFEWNDSVWLAFGSGTNTIANSSDGLSWTGQGTSIFSSRGQAAYWNASLVRFVAVGEGNDFSFNRFLELFVS